MGLLANMVICFTWKKGTEKKGQFFLIYPNSRRDVEYARELLEALNDALKR